jgi:hypothetical protein
MVISKIIVFIQAFRQKRKPWLNQRFHANAEYGLKGYNYTESKVSLCLNKTPWRHIGDWKQNALNTCLFFFEGGKLPARALAALGVGRKHPGGLEAGWAPEQIWMWWSEMTVFSGKPSIYFLIMDHILQNITWLTCRGFSDKIKLGVHPALKSKNLYLMCRK